MPSNKSLKNTERSFEEIHCLLNLSQVWRQGVSSANKQRCLCNTFSVPVPSNGAM